VGWNLGFGGGGLWVSGRCRWRKPDPGHAEGERWVPADRRGGLRSLSEGWSEKVGAQEAEPRINSGHSGTGRQGKLKPQSACDRERRWWKRPGYAGRRGGQELD